MTAKHMFTKAWYIERFYKRRTKVTLKCTYNPQISAQENPVDTKPADLLQFNSRWSCLDSKIPNNFH